MGLRNGDRGGFPTETGPLPQVLGLRSGVCVAMLVKLQSDGDTETAESNWKLQSMLNCVKV
jgi:hypothetical protein